MVSPSPERGRSRTRSHTPTSAQVRPLVRDHSPRRSISPRSASRSRSPDRTPSPRSGGRRNGIKGARSRSRSPTRTPSRSRSGGRDRRNYRDRSYTRSASRGTPVPRSSKVGYMRCCSRVSNSCHTDCRGTAYKERQRRTPSRNFWRIWHNPGMRSTYE